jgi:hypothetical protein
MPRLCFLTFDPARLIRRDLSRLPGACRDSLGHALGRRRLAHCNRRDDRGEQPKAGQRVEPAAKVPGVILEPTDERRGDAAAEDAERGAKLGGATYPW